MALDPRVPCEIEVLRDYLFGDQDDAAKDADIERAANSAIGRIEMHIGGPVLARDVTETHDGTGAAYLYTRAKPLISIASVTVDGVAAAVTGYAANLRSGKVSLLTGAFTLGTGNVVVAARVGYELATVPGDLFEAFLAYTKWLYDEKATGTLGRMAVSVGSQTVSVALRLPESIRLALAPYVDVRF